MDDKRVVAAGENKKAGNDPVGDGGAVWRAALSPEMLARVRELRKNPTPAEAFLWLLLRNRGLDGIKFRRQHPCQGYVLDFYCYAARLAVELDGGIHQEPEQRRRDMERTQILAEWGISVVRFSNRQVLEETEWVLEEIARLVRERTAKLPGNAE